MEKKILQNIVYISICIFLLYGGVVGDARSDKEKECMQLYDTMGALSDESKVLVKKFYKDEFGVWFGNDIRMEYDGKLRSARDCMKQAGRILKEFLRIVRNPMVSDSELPTDYLPDVKKKIAEAQKLVGEARTYYDENWSKTIKERYPELYSSLMMRHRKGEGYVYDKAQKLAARMRELNIAIPEYTTTTTTERPRKPPYYIFKKDQPPILVVSPAPPAPPPQMHLEPPQPKQPPPTQPPAMQLKQQHPGEPADIAANGSPNPQAAGLAHVGPLNPAANSAQQHGQSQGPGARGTNQGLGNSANIAGALKGLTEGKKGAEDKPQVPVIAGGLGAVALLIIVVALVCRSKGGGKAEEASEPLPAPVHMGVPGSHGYPGQAAPYTQPLVQSSYHSQKTSSRRSSQHERRSLLSHRDSDSD